MKGAATQWAAAIAGLAVAACSADRGGLAGDTSSADAVEQPLVNPPKNPNRTVAMTLVDTGAGVNTTTDQANQAVFDVSAGSKSLRAFVQQSSYGKQDITGSVFGPVAASLGTCSTSDTTGVANTLRPAIGTYDHYLWYWNTNSSCSWSGLGAAGSAAMPARDAWYNGSLGTVVVVAEFLTNLGLSHASFINCPNQSLAADLSLCAHDEYGDRFSVKGGAARDISAYQKAYLGWLGGCNLAKVRSSGTYTIYPLENPCDGIQALQIPMPTMRTFQNEALTSYYLELRAPYGFDVGLTPTVLVRVAGDIPSASSVGKHTWLLDMDPTTTGTTQRDGIAVGQTFTDPAGGVSFTLQSIDATKAVVQVTMTGSGAPTCLDGTTLPATPPTCSPPSDGGMGGTTGGTSSTGTTGTTGRSTTGTASASTGTTGRTTGGTTAAGTTTGATSASGSTTAATSATGTSTGRTTGGAVTTGTNGGTGSGATSSGAPTTGGGGSTTFGSPTNGGSTASSTASTATTTGATGSGTSGANLTTGSGTSGANLTTGANGTDSATGGTGGGVAGATNGGVASVGGTISGGNATTGAATAVSGGTGATEGDSGDPSLTINRTGGSCVCGIPGRGTRHAVGPGDRPADPWMGAVGLLCALGLRRRARRTSVTGIESFNSGR